MAKENGEGEWRRRMAKESVSLPRAGRHPSTPLIKRLNVIKASWKATVVFPLPLQIIVDNLGHS